MCKIDLYQGDCIDIMNQLIDKNIKVDAIITDPPYGATICKWDSIIPFDKMWDCIKRIRKDNSPIVLFGKQPFASLLISSNIKEYRYEIIWKKQQATNPFLANKQILNIHENIEIFYKKTGTYNPQTFLGKSYSIKQYDISVEKRPDNVFGRWIGTKEKINKKERFPVSVINFNNCRKKNLHPTQKPLELLEYLVKTYTNEGDTVLDFTMGSGTTGKACQILNRNFIGIEIDENYFNIAKERLINV